MSDGELTEVVKAYVLDSEVQTPNAVPAAEDDARVFSQIGAIVPPYDPRSLAIRFERSAALRPNVDAYAVNIEAFGHRLVPSIDLTAQDANDRLRDAILLEKLYDGEPPVVDPEEVAGRRALVEGEMRIEKLRTDMFFDYACAETSFVELREKTRLDLEVTGNAYWEVLRDKRGEIAQFVYLPSVSVRLMRADQYFLEVDLPRKVSAIGYRRVPVKRRFRRYVQLVFGQQVAYFKELDDPRTFSSLTGRMYTSPEALAAAEPGVPAATEVLHFKIHSPISAYGVPRWVGATLAVLGSRAAEEVNNAYFDNKAVPPLAILVSGGKLAAGAADRITEYIKNQVVGRENFHSVLVLEAEPSGGQALGAQQGSRVRIELRPLMEAQQQDALFQQYDANNQQKVGNQFRLPKLIRGETHDFNRATADAALRYAEQQVFQPERAKIDHIINRRVLASQGVRYWRFVSNSPVATDPTELTDIVAKLLDACAITPEEARRVVGDILNAELTKIDAPWVRMPPKLILGGQQPPPTPEELEAAEGEAASTDGAPKKPAIAIPPAEAMSILTVNEARSSLGLDPLAEHGDLTVAAFNALMKGGTSQTPTSAPNTSPPLGDAAKTLAQLNRALREAEGRVFEASVAEARRSDAENTIRVPGSEFNSWFEPSEPS